MLVVCKVSIALVEMGSMFCVSVVSNVWHVPDSKLFAFTWFLHFLGLEGCSFVFLFLVEYLQLIPTWDQNMVKINIFKDGWFYTNCWLKGNLKDQRRESPYRNEQDKTFTEHYSTTLISLYWIVSIVQHRDEPISPPNSTHSNFFRMLQLSDKSKIFSVLYVMMLLIFACRRSNIHLIHLYLYT